VGHGETLTRLITPRLFSTMPRRSLHQSWINLNKQLRDDKNEDDLEKTRREYEAKLNKNSENKEESKPQVGEESNEKNKEKEEEKPKEKRKDKEEEEQIREEMVQVCVTWRWEINGRPQEEGLAKMKKVE